MEGKEVVKREDIIPSSNEEWIVLQTPSVHKCCDNQGYHDGKLSFSPIDSCKFELVRLVATATSLSM